MASMRESDDDEEKTDSSKIVEISNPWGLRSLIDEERLLFDLKSKSLMPLCRIQATEDAVTVTFDLPYVEKDNISLTATDDTLSVEAKTRKAVTLRVGGSVQKRVQFERYTRLVRLP